MAKKEREPKKAKIFPVLTEEEKKELKAKQIKKHYQKEDDYFPEIEYPPLAKKEGKITKLVRPVSLKDKFAAKKEDIKLRAYQLIVEGYTSKFYLPILVDEFGLSLHRINVITQEVRDEVREQYNELYSTMKESLVLELMMMKINTTNENEKRKIIDLIIKITGLNQQNINVHQVPEDRTFIIHPFEDIETKDEDKKEEEE